MYKKERISNEQILQITPNEHRAERIKEARENPNVPIETVGKIWKTQLRNIADYYDESSRNLKLDEIAAYLERKYPDNEDVKFFADLCYKLIFDFNTTMDVFLKSLEEHIQMISKYEKETEKK